MNILKTRQDRRVVPRWRTVRRGVAPPEWSSTIAAPPIVPNDNTLREVNVTLADWRERRTPGLATEVLASGMLIKDEKIIQDAAAFLVKHHHVAPIVKDMAATLLAGGIKAEAYATSPRENIQRARRRLMQNPRDVLAALNLGHAYASIGQLIKAETYLNYALALAPTHRLVLRSTARYYLHINRPDLAHQLLQRAPNLLHDPWLLAAEVALSDVRGRTSKHMREASLLAESDNLSPLHRSELRTALASIELARGGAKKSKKLLLNALRQPTENVVAQAQFLTERKSISGLPLEAAMETTKNANEARGFAAFQNREWKKAVEAAEGWIKEEPFSMRPVGLGFHAADMGLDDCAKAEFFARHAVQVHPGEAIFHNNLAYVLALQNKLSEAKEAVEKGMVYLPGSAERERHGVVLRATQGLIEWRGGNLEAGRAGYQGAVDYFAERKDPALANAFVCWAREEFRGGDVQSGVALIKQASELERRHRDPLLSAKIANEAKKAQELIPQRARTDVFRLATPQSERMLGKEVKGRGNHNQDDLPSLGHRAVDDQGLR
jgi:tetratricopeptide (TPR) repeat protein